MSKEAYREIIQRLMKIPNPTKDDVNLIKVKVAGKHDLGKVPSNSKLIRHLKPDEKGKLLPILRRKIVRTISGVTIVAVMTSLGLAPKKIHAHTVPAALPTGFLRAIPVMNQPP